MMYLTHCFGHASVQGMQVGLVQNFVHGYYTDGFNFPGTGARKQGLVTLLEPSICCSDRALVFTAEVTGGPGAQTKWRQAASWPPASW